MELLVAMTLMMILVAISGMVFRAAVDSYRAASATSEILRKYQALTSQLDADLAGLQKNGEFILVWAPSPALNSQGGELDEDENDIPDRYDSFDRLYFFATGSFQTYNEQPTTTPGVTTVVSSNLARICYIFGRDANRKRALQEPDGRRRMLCRTQHLFTSDTKTFTAFPDWASADFINDFIQDNFSLEYQTSDMDDWMLYNQNQTDWEGIKRDIIANILDLTWDDTPLDTSYGSSVPTANEPRIDFNNPQTLHQLLCQGVGRFNIQIWRPDLNRWFPEIDPDYDGIYNEGAGDPGSTDYPLNGDEIDIINNRGIVINMGHPNAVINTDFDGTVGRALKFTFTLYDSNRIFPEGRTFTHIVYLPD